MTRARRPVTLYTVAGLPAARTHPEHDHFAREPVGWVVVRTASTGTDAWASTDESAHSNALAAEVGARNARKTGQGVLTIDLVYPCGCRRVGADPAADVLADSMPCESGDGYLDPAVDSEVVCQTDSGHYHDDCHAAVCQSRACHVFNFGED